MLQQRLERFVVLGKGVGLFTRCGADLGRRDNTKPPQHLRELRVRHEVALVLNACLDKQLLFALTHCDEVRLQLILVQL